MNVNELCLRKLMRCIAVLKMNLPIHLKFYRIMKLTVIALTILCLQVSASAFSQRFSLSEKNAVLDVVLKKIKQQSGYLFLYDSELMQLARPVTVEVKNASLEEVLQKCLAGQPFTYELVNKTIVIKLKEAGTQKADIPVIRIDTVGGTVINASGVAIQGVSVGVKGTTKGTITDERGRFRLPEVPEDAILVFRMIGFEGREEHVTPGKQLNVVLKAELSKLGEVVVVGYGTQKRSDLTGAVSSVRGEQLSGQAISNPVQALTGLAPGVQVLQNSGEPGSALSVRVRGGNSLIGGNEPMYVIDGFPINGTLDNINPNDILSIEVLKDASATAIYGSRGANGVVMVTTKKGKTGRTLVEYDTYFGLQQVTKKIDMLNAREFATIANVRAANDNEAPFFTDAEINALGKGTDWQNEIFRTSPIQNHSLSVFGGNDRTRFSLSGSYFDQKGVIRNSYYNQAQLRANLDHNINNNWKVSFNNIVSRTKNNFLFSNNTERGAGVLSGALIAPPTVPVYDANGNYSNVRKYSFSPDIAENPVAMALERKNVTTKSSLLTNVFIEGKVLPDLVFRSSVGVQYDNTRVDFYSPTIFQPSARGSASISYAESMNIVNENTLTYTKTVNNDHHFTLLAGLTSEKNTGQGVTASATGFLTNILENNSLQSGTSPGIPTSYINEYAILSGLGRVNYSYKGKYLLTASIRADGSSRFGKANRWGYFPSTALAWRVSEEDFWEGIKPVINDFKLRGSWGVTGNTAVSPYQSLSILSSVQTVFDENLYIGFAPGSIKPNPELKWETTTQLDMGVDISLFNSRLMLNFDYYSKRTNDLLSSVPVSSSTGYSTTIKNLGAVQNRGIEAAITAYILEEGAFKWDLGANLSMNRNKVISLSGGTDIFGEILGNTLPAMSLVREGYPIGVFYGYLEDGLDNNGAIKYKDLDKSGSINSLDRTIIGDPNPDYIIGLNSHMSYKNFDLTVLVTSVQGVDVLNYNLSNVADGFSFGINQVKDILGNYWTADNPNPNAKYPKISKNTRYLGSDRFIEDGSYIRVKNIQLSYTLKKDKLVSAGSQIYVAVQNPFTFTNYSFYSPEINTRGAGISRGIDQFGYPDARSFMLGLRVKF
jgi:TonB-linked SusC/RagA family outer membrane protein